MVWILPGLWEAMGPYWGPAGIGFGLSSTKEAPTNLVIKSSQKCWVAAGCLNICDHFTVDSRKLEHGCRTILSGLPSFFGMG